MPNNDYNYPQFSVLPPPVATKSAKTLSTSTTAIVIPVETGAKNIRMYPKTVDHFLRFGSGVVSSADDEWDFVIPAGAVVDITIPKEETTFSIVSAAIDILYLTQR